MQRHEMKLSLRQNTHDSTAAIVPGAKRPPPSPSSPTPRCEKHLCLFWEASSTHPHGANQGSGSASSAKCVGGGSDANMTKRIKSHLRVSFGEATAARRALSNCNKTRPEKTWEKMTPGFRFQVFLTSGFNTIWIMSATEIKDLRKKNCQG